MPRSRRSRAAPTRAAKAASPVAVPLPAQAPEPEPEPQTAKGTTPNISSDIYDVSDREKEKAKERRKSLRIAATSTRTRTASMSGKSQELNQARQRRDSAMMRLENITSTTDTAADDSNGRSDTEIEVEVGRRNTATPLQDRMADLSGLDLDDSMFDDINTTFETAGPTSAHRSADTSTLSATHFKRRPRAGSFLSRDDGPIRPSSRAGPNTPGLSSTFNIGVFKRRAREPSILGTAQKPRPQRSEPEPDTEMEQADDDDDNDEQDDFAPEDESTPLRRASQRRSGHAEAAAASPSVNPRKRKSTEGHEQRVRSSPYGVKDSIEDAVEEDSSEPASPQPSLPRMPQDRPSTPIMDESLMAPPLSSSSASDSNPEIWPPLQSLAKGRTRRAPSSVLRRTPVPNDDNVSDMSSPPSLTYSPNYAEPSSPPAPQTRGAKQRRASKPEPKVTTAELAGMLPRRRRRAARGAGDDSLDPGASDAEEEEEEVDASGLGADEDELSYLDVRASRRARSTRNNNNNSNSNKNNKGKQTRRKTYGRSSDKENQQTEEEEEREGSGDDNGLGEEEEEEDEEKEDSVHMTERVGEELKNAARKFQEVDKWELEYEEMTENSSPPPDAR
ncbi:hypothetical protein F4810DRAFT_655143 [Camillea tinctor]|nr:hypothetical protein F4810DRAFT_655143 [Camillea tinctor]